MDECYPTTYAHMYVTIKIRHSDIQFIAAELTSRSLNGGNKAKSVHVVLHGTREEIGKRMHWRE